MKKIKVISIFGTRPEAIKMAPVVKRIEQDPRFDSLVVVTGQHREMLDQVLSYFDINPDCDLEIMSKNQTLSEITINIMSKLTTILQDLKPDIVLVHGDTTTTFAAALAAFYQGIKIGHVEAGLRTWDKFSPFPEEINRQLTDDLADLYFAPTIQSKANLIRESHPEDRIIVTGNTAIDAMRYTVKSDYTHPILRDDSNKKIILLTMHRRENQGDSMINVFRAIKRLAETRKDITVVFPMHKNPLVREKAKKYLEGSENILLIEPLDVMNFHNIAANSTIILTDSGGVQEEAPSLGVPVLVLRDTTERPEGVEAGTLKLIGTNEERVLREINRLLDDTEEYKKMSQASNPYGDGKASDRILKSIEQYFTELD